MKKILLFLFLVVLVGTNFSFAGKKSSEKEIIVSGFDGSKPLKKNEVIPVSFPEYSEDIWLIDAYKGETRVSFIKRIDTKNKEDVKYIPTYFVSSSSKNSIDLENKKIEVKKVEIKDSSKKKLPWSLGTKIEFFFIFLFMFICLIGSGLFDKKIKIKKI